MEKQCTVTVEFNQLSKSVTARAKVELQGEYSQELLDEVYIKGRELFDKAYAYAKVKTMEM